MAERKVREKEEVEVKEVKEKLEEFLEDPAVQQGSVMETTAKMNTIKDHFEQIEKVTLTLPSGDALQSFLSAVAMAKVALDALQEVFEEVKEEPVNQILDVVRER